MPQHRSKIVGVLPQPPDRREGPDSLARTLCASKLVLDLSLLPLEFLHDLLDQDRVDPGGDAAQLRVLIRLDVGQPRLEPCPSPEGLLATTPNEGLMVSLQGCQAVRTEELPIQDPNYLGLEAIVPDASLAAGALPIPDGLLGPARPLDCGHPAAAVAENHPPKGLGGPARLRSATPVGLRSAPHALRSLPEFEGDDRGVSRHLRPHPLSLGVHPVAAGLPPPPVPHLEAGVLGVVEDPRDRSATPRPTSS